jgi:hypothetical protein
MKAPTRMLIRGVLAVCSYTRKRMCISVSLALLSTPPLTVELKRERGVQSDNIWRIDLQDGP